jgi:hypothetical protein
MNHVIFNSIPWKLDLKRTASDLGKRKRQRVWRHSSYAKLEREIMVGFYAIRKLSESHRLAEDFGRINVPVVTFPWIGKTVGYFVWPEVEKHFDLTSAKNTVCSVEFLWNQIIHTSVFSPWFTPTGELAGIFFASDRKKHTEVYRLELQRIIDIFNAAAGSRPKGWLRIAPDRNLQVM